MPHSILKELVPKTISFSLDDKKIVWLAGFNTYVLVVSPIDEIIKRIFQNESDQQIIDYCRSQLDLNYEEACEVLAKVQSNLKELQHKKRHDFEIAPEHYKRHIPFVFKHKRFYRINGIVFQIEYETAELEHFIHPKFAHLEIIRSSVSSNHFQLFWVDKEMVLIVNKELIGNWSREMEHFMSGKVSMEILQRITATKERDWMGVFHAAGISDGKQGVLFLGDSGNGKSTLSAILMASGFEVLSDDFLPVDGKTGHLTAFPAAISVKKTAIDMLSSQFPELINAQEYAYPASNKWVRYLSNPLALNKAPERIPCKALVFVKYEENSDLEFIPLQKDIAFQKLVPDSWISPEPGNAEEFINWFTQIPCFQLTYSNNAAMLKTVKKIFADETNI